jgi:hypothetical protein
MPGLLVNVALAVTSTLDIRYVAIPLYCGRKPAETYVDLNGSSQRRRVLVPKSGGFPVPQLAAFALLSMRAETKQPIAMYFNQMVDAIGDAIAISTSNRVIAVLTHASQTA